MPAVLPAFRLEDYLDRLGLGDVPPGAAGLARLQEAHMRAIPFENIDPLLGRVPALGLADVTAKLVQARRGGYCFEHNRLFGAALEALGHRPRAVLARVFAPSGESGARSHLAFVVEAGGTRWLCDTGFGGHGALAPLDIDAAGEQAVAGGSYRVRTGADGLRVLERRAGAAWVAQYAWDDDPVRAVDIEAANFLCARWDRAPFAANLMVAFHGGAGRVALFNRALTLGAPPDAEAQVLASQGDLARVLCGHCGLALDSETLAAVWRRIEGAPTRR